MLQVHKLARLGQPVPLLAAFPFSISVGETATPLIPPGMDHVCMGKRDYSTCVNEESVGGFLAKSKSDVKKDD